MQQQGLLQQFAVLQKLTAPVLLLHQENAFNYDKGVLAEILEPIMGKGLIPADLETWKPRRRAIVPAFHKAYLETMVAMFGACTQETIRRLDALTADGEVTHLPSCCALALAISHRRQP